jgi:uncharacterized protein YijF (DUF1287 family)
MRRGLLLALCLLPAIAAAQEVGAMLARKALEQVGVTTSYDPAYVALAYPGGDVAPQTGVCADVVVRAFRGIGVDLQREVHEDMRRAFDAYPKLWGLKRPDRNIDHRRVANLMRFFERRGVRIDSDDWRAGDIVAWRLDNGLLHIGVVGETPVGATHPPVIHNIGAGARAEDVLFAWTVLGHYRWKFD